MGAPYSSANTDVRPYVRTLSTQFSTDSQPTLSEVTNIISQIDGEIDSSLIIAGITAPSTNLSNLLKKYSAMGSAGLVVQTYGEEDGNFQKGEWFYNQYIEWIDKVTTDDKYQDSLYNLNAGSVSGTYVSDQVIAGYVESTDISYIDEDFKP